MSDTGESNLPTLLPIPIAQMGPWSFWANPYAVGLDLADADALRRGTATEAQVARGLFCGQAAMNVLISTPCLNQGNPS